MLSTGISIPVLVEGKYVIRGETADFSLVEPTVVQLMKTFRHFIYQKYQKEAQRQYCSTCQTQVV